jgi:hypothetical protein
MDQEVLGAIAKFMDENKVSYKWKKVTANAIMLIISCPHLTYSVLRCYFRETSLPSTIGEVELFIVTLLHSTGKFTKFSTPRDEQAGHAFTKLVYWPKEGLRVDVWRCNGDRRSKTRWGWSGDQ